MNQNRFKVGDEVRVFNDWAFMHDAVVVEVLPPVVKEHEVSFVGGEIVKNDPPKKVNYWSYRVEAKNCHSAGKLFVEQESVLSPK